jgi:hypothetical protein
MHHFLVSVHVGVKRKYNVLDIFFSICNSMTGKQQMVQETKIIKIIIFVHCQKYQDWKTTNGTRKKTIKIISFVHCQKYHDRQTKISTKNKN